MAMSFLVVANCTALLFGMVSMVPLQPDPPPQNRITFFGETSKGKEQYLKANLPDPFLRHIQDVFAAPSKRLAPADAPRLNLDGKVRRAVAVVEESPPRLNWLFEWSDVRAVLNVWDLSKEPEATMRVPCASINQRVNGNPASLLAAMDGAGVIHYWSLAWFEENRQLELYVAHNDKLSVRDEIVRIKALASSANVSLRGPAPHACQ